MLAHTRARTTHTYTHTYTHTRTRTHTHTHTHACTHVHTHAHTRTCRHISTSNVPLPGMDPHFDTTMAAAVLPNHGHPSAARSFNVTSDGAPLGLQVCVCVCLCACVHVCMSMCARHTLLHGECGDIGWNAGASIKCCQRLTTEVNLCLATTCMCLPLSHSSSSLLLSHCSMCLPLNPTALHVCCLATSVCVCR